MRADLSQLLKSDLYALEAIQKSIESSSYLSKPKNFSAFWNYTGKNCSALSPQMRNTFLKLLFLKNPNTDVSQEKFEKI